MRKNKGVINGKYSEKTKAVKMREYIRGKGTRNYDNIVAYQEEIDDFFYNVKLRLDSTEHAIVKCDGNTKALCPNGRSYVFNPNDKVKWPFHEVDDNTYQITYIAAHDLKGKLTINLPKEGRNIEIPVGYKYNIYNPEKFIGTIGPDESYNRYKTWTSNGLQREINQAISSLVFSEMSVFFQSNKWSRMVHYLSERIVDEIAEKAKLGKFGVKLTSLWFDLQTLAESMTDKEFIETRDQFMNALEKHFQEQKMYMSDGFNDIKNQNIELTEGTRAHVSAVGEDNKATTKSEIKGSEERLGAKMDEKTEEIKDFIAKRDGIIKDILENVKAGKGSGVSSEDIKKYFDITNATVAAEINKLIDKINVGKHLSDEEFVQATKAVECTDPKDLKNTPQLTLNFILDNTSKDWHASMAADVIYHQLEKWLSKKKITSAMFKGEQLLRFFKQCPEEVFDENGECILDDSFKKTGSIDSIEHRLFEQKEWVLLKDVKWGIKPHNGLKCYFALRDNGVIKNDVKYAIDQCKQADEYWWQMNKMRHFGTQDSMKKLAEQGLSDVKARQKRLIEITEFFKTGVFETEDALADII